MAVLFGLACGLAVGVPWSIVLFLDEDRRRVRKLRANRLELTRSLTDRMG